MNFTDRWSLKTDPRLNIHSLSAQAITRALFAALQMEEVRKEVIRARRSNEVLSLAILHLIRLFLITKHEGGINRVEVTHVINNSRLVLCKYCRFIQEILVEALSY
ncbi:hypothetical protein TNIN_49221 [Trichonephila inaurata madagascariensis]|uniref:Uncharacterized protein n=1 Tax=Trichonephila inaurata madagascariensis TaxID=2747483 RepID=A0A8X7CIY1_9ARAC|nr:hypothetical protein TNIN_49221 [Trichonephila inaurata madagascariensis]